MIPLYPYHIRRSRDGQCAELLLKLEGRDSAFIIHLSLEQARLLAVEMRGLATDHCPQHHLTCSVLQALSAGISSVILKGLERGLVMGALRLERETGFVDVEGDVAAVLGMAIHLGLPIFMGVATLYLRMKWWQSRDQPMHPRESRFQTLFLKSLRVWISP
jgi:bifunctional DNase/RNase